MSPHTCDTYRMIDYLSYRVLAKQVALGSRCSTLKRKVVCVKTIFKMSTSLLVKSSERSTKKENIKEVKKK